MPINYQAKMSRSIAAIDLQDKGQASKAACPTTSASKARRFYGLCEDEKAVASWSQTAVLQSIFKQAYKLEIITTNPAKAEKLTLPREVQPKIDIFSKAEAAEMLKCLESEPLAFQTLVQLAIITGARRGE